MNNGSCSTPVLIPVIHIHYLHLLVALDSVANQLFAGWYELIYWF